IPPRSEIHIGARGFEPPTSWSQTTRSTKLSYAPDMQRDCYTNSVLAHLVGEPDPSGHADVRRPRSGRPTWWSTPNSMRAASRLLGWLRFAGSRNQLLDRVRSARPRNISNPDAKNITRSRWRRDASQTTPLV